MFKSVFKRMSIHKKFTFIFLLLVGLNVLNKHKPHPHGHDRRPQFPPLWVATTHLVQNMNVRS